MGLRGQRPGVPSGTANAVQFVPRVRGSLVYALVMSGVWVYLVTTMAGEGLVAVVALVALLPSIAFRWLLVVAVVRQPWAVEIDRDGVRWWAGRSMRWAEIERVEVQLTRGWRRFLLLPHALDRVVFVTPVQASFADRSGTRASGYSVLVRRVRTTPSEVVHAVERLSEVPVHGWPEGR